MLKDHILIYFNILYKPKITHYINDLKVYKSEHYGTTLNIETILSTMKLLFYSLFELFDFCNKYIHKYNNIINAY